MPAIEPPPGTSKLSTLPVLALDLETTGLDVTRDRIVQVAAYFIDGECLLTHPAIDTLVNPGIPIPAPSTQIHGINDETVRAAPSFELVCTQLRKAIRGRVVIGHHIGFDQAVLRFEAARRHLVWREPRSLDLAMLAGALEPALPDLSLETLADWLGVEVRDRHSAAGDALAAAQIFIHLLPRLADRGVDTLADATSFAASRDDLLIRQEHAGWNRDPGAIGLAPAKLPAVADSNVYAISIRQIAHTPAQTISSDTSLTAAARAMASARVGSLFVIGRDNRPLGVLTERDLLYAVGDESVDLAQCRVDGWMSSPVESLRGTELLYRALARMRRKSIRHLAVVDEAGVLTGVLSQRDLLRHRADAIDTLSDGLSEAVDVDELAQVHASLPELAAALIEERLDGSQVAAVISSEVRALTARSAMLTEQRLIEEGLGAAPAAWCLFVLGSAGRGESLLSADQDNAVIHTGNDSDDPWFAEFGKGIESLLHQIGIPRCQGGVMASNPLWRGTREVWQKRVRDWVVRTRSEDLLNLDIFFDMYPVAGDEWLLNELHSYSLATVAQHPPLLGLLTDPIAGAHTPLGWLGRIKTRDGRVDLKAGALFPLVGSARVLALRCGSHALSTMDRLNHSVVENRLATQDAERLGAIHKNLLTLVLEQQLADLRNGLAPGNKVKIASLGRKAISDLTGDLRYLENSLTLLRPTVQA